MKKRVLSIVISIILILTFTGCNKNSEQVEIKNCEIAFITDEGTVEDGGRNEQCWKGVKKYAEEKGIEAQYFSPKDITKESYMTQIKSAVKSGAEVVVCPGNLLEEAVFDAQKQYKNVHFILVEGEPHNSDYSEVKIGDNTLSLTFSEEEAGFLAGYAAVREGYTYLGFLGGMPEESVVRYGYGFVQGADYAAIEMGIKIYVAYVYANTFTEDINIKNMAGNWFENGCEIIFACGDNMNHSVIKAAEEYKKDCILPEPILNHMSSSVLFTCTKNIEDGVYDSIASYYSNTFLGGQEKRLSVTEDGVGIDFENAHLKQFSEIEYDAIYSLLKSNQIKPYSGTELTTTDELNLVNTVIVYAEY